MVAKKPTRDRAMYDFPLAMKKLIHELSKLPSVGNKSATRLAYHLLYKSPNLAENLAEALTKAVATVRFCSTCFALADSTECSICSDEKRDQTILCVVEKPLDVLSIDRTGDFGGRFHVLHGLWSPLKGQDIEDLKVSELFDRLQREPIVEIILGLGSTLEGDATSLYLAEELPKIKPVTISRLAQGIPKGGELEYADEVTLSRALAGRRNM